MSPIKYHLVFKKLKLIFILITITPLRTSIKFQLNQSIIRNAAQQSKLPQK